MIPSCLREEYRKHGRFLSCPVYDLHGHMGPFYGIYLPLSDPDRMAAEMDRRGIARLVFSHHWALMGPSADNGPAIEAIRRHPDKFLGYWGIHPTLSVPDEEIRRFEQHRDMFVGFKFLAGYHGVALSDPSYQPYWEYARARKLLVLSHTWGDNSKDGAAVIGTVLERYPDIRLILGHSIHGAWETAISFARQSPDVYLDLCAVLDETGIVELLVEKAGSEKVTFGTDFPWFGYPYYIGALLGAEITDEDRHNILHRNAERILPSFL